MTKEFMTIADVCSMMGISNSTFYQIRFKSDMDFPRPVKSANKSSILFIRKDIEE